MKYYNEPTNQAGATDPDFDVLSIKAYQDYIHSVWDVLPKELQRLYVREVPFSPDVVYLNDSGVESVEIDFADKTVEIVLWGEARNKVSYVIGDRHFHLRYSAVERLVSTGLRGEFWPGLEADHVWDEIEVLEGNRYEHRMLFRGGPSGRIEMTIVFGEFSLS